MSTGLIARKVMSMRSLGRITANVRTEQRLRMATSRKIFFAASISDSLSDALLSIGTGIVKASISPSANGIYKVAVSESSRFKEAAESYWKFDPNRVIEQVRKQLELA